MMDTQLIPDLLIQGVQMTSVLVLAPLLTGLVRIVKARLQRRRARRYGNPIATCAAFWARKWCWRKMRPGCFARRHT